MKRIVIAAMFLIIISSLVWADDFSANSSKYWHQWRGPDATGVAVNGDPPAEWSETKNIRWKTEIPGLGHSSPIVWEDTIFITTAIKTDKVPEAQEEPAEENTGRRRRAKKPKNVYKFDVLAINRKNGEILWQRTVGEELPHAGIHNDSSFASHSPITDGEHVYAYFGSYGLYCLDMEGNLVWDKDFGDMRTRGSFGEGSSPALHGDTLIINWDHEDQSFIFALNKKTGEEIWKMDRDERTSWATPLIIDYKGRLQVIVNATNRVRSYDLATGEVIWECGGMTANVIPCPMVADNLLYVTSGFRGNALLAINLDLASGDITDSDAIAWSYDGKDTPYTPSALLYKDTLYFLKSNKAIISCLNSKTGQVYYNNQKLDGLGDTYVSPVGASERVYVTGRNGITKVIKRGPELEILATNSLNDEFSASPAMVDKEMFMRGFKYLYCIAED